MFKLPQKYYDLTFYERKQVREQYIAEQNGKCMYCSDSLDNPPVTQNRKINLNLFPEGFMDHPIHLQHDHSTGYTEGAVHAYCNAVLWQYENR